MKSKHKYFKYVNKNKYKIINCNTCGYWHVFPMPTENEIAKYYETEYYETIDDVPTVKDKLDDPDSFYHLQYEDRLRQITRLLPSDLPKTVLDIGAGYGDFLAFMKNNGWKVQGIEPSIKAYQNIKDKTLNIKLASINDLPKELNPSSVITLNNVLEHLREPHKILEIIKKYLLLDRGILLIIVPNDFNILQYILMNTLIKNMPEKHNYWISPPAHLNYWSHRTMKKYIKKNGFNILYLTTEFPMEIFPFIGYNYIAHPEVGKKAHLKRVKFEKFLKKANLSKFKDLFYESFAKIGIGRDTHIYVTK